jgi:voltage-dependent calcium channel P/Q type alpha-1A
VLDFIILIISLFDTIVKIDDSFSLEDTLHSTKAIRTIRAIRSLRLIRVSGSLRLIIKALISSIPGMLSVIFVLFIFLLIFAILGIYFFKGKFFTCTFPMDIKSKLEKEVIEGLETVYDCLNYGGKYVKSLDNFDKLSTAILVLYEMIMIEGWTENMYMAVESRKP